MSFFCGFFGVGFLFEYLFDPVEYFGAAFNDSGDLLNGIGLCRCTDVDHFDVPVGAYNQKSHRGYRQSRAAATAKVLGIGRLTRRLLSEIVHAA